MEKGCHAHLRLGRLVKFELKAAADVPATVLWSELTDIARIPSIRSDVSRVDRIDGDSGFGVGTRWTETRSFMKRPNTETMEVVEIVPGRSFTVETDSRGARYWSTYVIDGGSENSTVTWNFQAEPKGLWSRFFSMTLGRILAAPVRSVAERELAELIAAAERDRG